MNLSEREARVRVLAVSHSEAVWGAERVLLALAPLLADRGVELTLAAPVGGAFAREWVATEREHVPLDVPPHTGLRRADGSRPSPLRLAHETTVVTRSARRIASMMRGFDLAHSNSQSAHAEVALAGRLARRPAVLHLHDLVVPGLGQRVLSTAVVLSSRAVAISDAVRDCVPARLHRKIDVVHNGVSTTRFAPGPPDAGLRAELGARRDELLVGVLGRIDPEKGHDVVIRAVGRLRPHLPVRLAVVGAPLRDANGWYDHLRAVADEAAPGAVTFAPPRDDVPRLLRSLDALVSAAPAEPFGLTILEAQACGTPSVAARGGGVPEIVDDGVTGRLFAPRDTGGLADTLEEVLTDTVATARIVAAARARVVEHSSLERQADRFATVYRSAVGAEPDRVTAWN